MGLMQRKVTSIQLEEKMGRNLFLLSLLAGGWCVIIAGVLAKGEHTQPAVTLGVVQILTSALFGIGYCHAVYCTYKIYINCRGH